MLIAYTDGSTYKTNPGPMSWAVCYVRNNEIVREASGALYQGTNNKAELLAVIWALDLERSEDLVVRTDSTLVLNVATGIWQARTNRELWEVFDKSLALREKRGLVTEFQYVKAHSSNPYNRRVDALARAAALLAAKCVPAQE